MAGGGGVCERWFALVTAASSVLIFQKLKLWSAPLLGLICRSSPVTFDANLSSLEVLRVEIAEFDSLRAYGFDAISDLTCELPT
mmetsp:Transcript_66499/g.147737  ORF Transcript_66499/g.147737 Transcript_66499/m.147737 type:complete len:84 (+) Transcript_66499:427-678(+)